MKRKSIVFACILGSVSLAQEEWFPEPGPGVTVQYGYEANIDYTAEIMPDVLAAGVATGVVRALDAVGAMSPTNVPLTGKEVEDWIGNGGDWNWVTNSFGLIWNDTNQYGAILSNNYAGGMYAGFSNMAELVDASNKWNQAYDYLKGTNSVGFLKRVSSVWFPGSAYSNNGGRVLLLSLANIVKDHNPSVGAIIDNIDNEMNDPAKANNGFALYSPPPSSPFWTIVGWIRTALGYALQAVYWIGLVYMYVDYLTVAKPWNGLKV